MNYKDTRKRIGLKGMFKIGSREWWTLDGKHIYFVSLPEYAAASVKSFFTSLLIAAGFYATKCGCKHGHDEKPLKFRLNRCKDCWNRQISSRAAIRRVYRDGPGGEDEPLLP